MDWEAFADLLSQALCRVLGHAWVEIPYALRRSVHNPHPSSMRFRCARCGLVAGFTN